MKKNNAILSVLLCITLLISAFLCSAASSRYEEYIAVHSEEEFDTLFNQVKDYLTENQERIKTDLGETENALVSAAFVRAWGIHEYEDATPEQIDNAYDALFNAFLFTGIILEWKDTLYTDENAPETMFTLARQVIDQEYYDLLEEEGEEETTIDNAKRIRDEAEDLADHPENFSKEEKDQALGEIYSEVYMASGLRSISYTKKLPTSDELFPGMAEGDSGDDSEAGNPAVEYETSEPLNTMLGIEMPDLTKKFEFEPELYSIIADVVADVRFSCGEGTVLIRASVEPDVDISGVYGAEFYEDWTIYQTPVEVDTYQKMRIAKGSVQISSDEVYSFAIDAEGIDEDTFRDMTEYVIETFRNQSKNITK